MKRTLILGLLVSFVLSPNLLPAEETFKGYHQAETEHFTFIFDKDSKAEAEQFATYADTAWQKIAHIYGMPQDKTKVFMTSNTDVVNAFAMSDTFYMGMYTNPNNIIDFGFRTNWHELFFTHELIHIANMNFENRRSKSFSFAGSLFPMLELRIPTLALEGLTTVLETELTAGGRGRSPYFEMQFKAAAMENNLVTYDQIGNGATQPAGQDYVYGYVITRTIADIYGIQALADIERNRELFEDWESAVYRVTGSTPEYIWNDAKKALDKKYAAERLIPEGKVVTPHSMHTSYYPKMIVLHDGSIIALRITEDDLPAAVRYTPETDTEELLFTAGFSSNDGFTASNTGTIVFTNTTTYGHKKTGATDTTQLYTWTEDTGILPLTKGSSLFQPALSKDGSRLVAIELHNGRYRIVEIALSTGERSVILESDSKDYLQPSLSDNGNFLVCLEADDHHAAVVTCTMPDGIGKNIPQLTLKRIYNNVPDTAEPTAFADPGYPAFTRGKITFSSNERGRLEIFECDYNGSHLRPVVADPIAALSCQVIDTAVYYTSWASTGYVLKVKPIESWGQVPDFEGPSLPGHILTFGNLVDDYPDFIPFSVTRSNTISRPEYLQQRDFSSEPVIFSLSGERRYVDVPHLFLLCPEWTLIPDGNNKNYFGTGISTVGINHIKQNNSRLSIYTADFNYIFKLNQITGNLFFSTQKGSSTLMANAFRSISTTKDVYSMTESTGFFGSYSLPLYSAFDYFSDTDTAIITAVSLAAQRFSNTPFSMSSPMPFVFSSQIGLGIDTANRIAIGTSDLYLSGSATASWLLQPKVSVNQLVYEAETAVNLTVESLWYGISARARWFDLPGNATLPQNITTLNVSNVSCLYPGRIIADFNTGSYFGNLLTTMYIQKMISFGKNSKGLATPVHNNLMNGKIDDETYLGSEIGLLQGRLKAVIGLAIPFSAIKQHDISAFSAYASVKIDGYRNSFPDILKALR